MLGVGLEANQTEEFPTSKTDSYDTMVPVVIDQASTGQQDGDRLVSSRELDAIITEVRQRSSYADVTPLQSVSDEQPTATSFNDPLLISPLLSPRGSSGKVRRVMGSGSLLPPRGVFSRSTTFSILHAFEKKENRRARVDEGGVALGGPRSKQTNAGVSGHEDPEYASHAFAEKVNSHFVAYSSSKNQWDVSRAKRHQSALPTSRNVSTPRRAASAHSHDTARRNRNYAELAYAWDSRRKQRLAEAMRLIEEEETAQMGKKFTNHITEKLAREWNSEQRGKGVFERVYKGAAHREKRRCVQEENFKPLPPPDGVKRIPRKVWAHACEDERKAQTAPRKHTSKSKKKRLADSPPPHSLLFYELYHHAIEQKAEQRRKHEEMLAERKRAARQCSTRRTAKEIQTHIERMLLQDEERKKRQMENVARACEAEVSTVQATPKICDNAAQLAERYRQRQEEKSASAPAVLSDRTGMSIWETSANDCAPNSTNIVRTAPRRSLEFEQRTAKMLEQRALKVDAIRQEIQAKEMQECTFKPRVCPESQRIVERSDPLGLWFATPNRASRVTSRSPPTTAGEGPAASDERIGDVDDISPLPNPSVVSVDITASGEGESLHAPSADSLSKDDVQRVAVVSTRNIIVEGGVVPTVPVTGSEMLYQLLSEEY